MKKIFTILSAFVLSLTIMVSPFMAGCGETSATSIMACSVNPEVNFLLDQNNNVMSVACTNQDAQILLLDVNFKGKSAEEAAQLFVKLSTEAGYIDINTKGTQVSVSLFGDEDVISSLKTKVNNKINSYFDENGIIAGAFTTLETQIDNISQRFYDAYITTDEMASKTQEEVFALLQERAEKFDGLLYSQYSEVFTKINNLKASLNIDSIKNAMDSALKQIENSLLPESAKKTARELYETQKGYYETAIKNFNTQLDSFIETLKTNAKTQYETLRTTLQTKITNTKTVIDAHKDVFEQNKEDINQSIKNFRESLVPKA